MMKKIILFLALVLSSASLMAQEKEVLISEDSIISKDYTYDFINQASSPLQYNISMGASFGSGFFGQRFTSTYIAPSLRIKLNQKTHLRAGALTGDV